MSEFDMSYVFRVVIICIAIFVLFTLVYYYYTKQVQGNNATVAQSTQSTKEKFYDYAPSNQMDEGANAMYGGTGPLALDNTAPVQPNSGEEEGKYRSVDYKSSQLPVDCFPRDRLTSEDLLPADANSKWAQVNPAGQGDVANQNFLTAGWAVGINTVSGTLRNANLQLRSEPANPRTSWPINNSTIEADLWRRPIEGLDDECKPQ
jgi:hypothetical protein